MDTRSCEYSEQTHVNCHDQISIGVVIHSSHLQIFSKDTAKLEIYLGQNSNDGQVIKNVNITLATTFF